MMPYGQLSLDPASLAAGALAAAERNRKITAEIEIARLARERERNAIDCRYCASYTSTSGACVCSGVCASVSCPMIEGDRYPDVRPPCPIFAPERLPIGRVFPGRSEDVTGASYERDSIINPTTPMEY